MQIIMNSVEQHGQTWRYSFNLKKSAVMVYSETNSETYSDSSLVTPKPEYVKAVMPHGHLVHGDD